MLVIGSEIYEMVAEKLIEKIATRGYFRGAVEIDTPELYAELKGTFLIHRTPLREPDNMSIDATRIKEISPVWWEFSTFQCCGEVHNTFSWSEFENHLPIW